MTPNVFALPLVRRLWALLMLSGVTLLASCGGGGGADSSTGGGGGGLAPTLTADYYPLNVGDTRAWRITQGSEMGEVRSERVAAVGAVGAEQAYTVASFDLGPEYLARRTTGVFSVPGPGSDAFTTTLGPVEILRFGLAVGQTVLTLEKSFTVDADGDGLTDGFDVRIESTLVGFEPITTAAGTFADTAKMRTVLRITVRSGSGGTDSTVTTIDEWLARDVGPVRFQTSSVSPGRINSELEEVIAFAVGNQRSDTLAPTLVSTTPKDSAAFFVNYGGVLLQFSEVIDPFSASVKGAISLVDAQGREVALLIEVLPNGTELRLTSEVSLEEGSYELRLGAPLTDIAGNSLPATSRILKIDTTRPYLISSTPADGSENAPQTGTVVLTYNEPVFEAPDSPLQFSLRDTWTGEAITMPGQVDGTNLRVILPTPLLRNRQYELRVISKIVDGFGYEIQYGSEGVTFRTDPGPLSRPYSLGGGVAALIQADLNGDGRPDLVSLETFILEGNKAYVVARFKQHDGSYLPPKRVADLPGLCSSNGLAVGHANSDDLPDIILQSCTIYDGPTVLLQSAPSVFTLDGSPISAYTTSVGAVDVDGDGRDEFVLVSSENGTKSLRAIRRNAAGAWLVALDIDQGAHAYGEFLFADINGDGRRDIVMTRLPSLGARWEVAWALAQANGFGPFQSVAVNGDLMSPMRLSVGDVNSDGRPDVVSTHEFFLPASIFVAHQLLVLTNNGAGGFLPPQVTQLRAYSIAVGTGDIDGDGRTDIVVGYEAGQVSIFLQGSNAALEPERLFEGPYSNSQEDMVLTDLNNDGRLDVLLASSVLYGRPYTGTWPLSTNASRKQSQSVVPGRSPVKASAGRWRSALQWRAPSP